MYSPVQSRASAQPRDMGQRVLRGLYPQSYGAPQPQPAPSYGGMNPGGAPPAQPYGAAPQPQPQSPTGLPISRPAPSGPPQAALGGVLNKQAPDPYGNMNPEDRGSLNSYDKSLYAGPDYKGRHEANTMLEGEYARMLDRWRNEAPIDYSGAAPIHDEFQRGRSQLEARLAAMGHSGGGGVMAGAESSFQGQENTAVGDWIRKMIEDRRREHLTQQNEFDQYGRQVGLMGLQRNFQQQDDPGFWGDLAGVVGGVGGKALDAYLGGTGPFDKGK